MSIHTNANFEDAEEEGRTELVLAAVTYVGERSTYNSEGMRSQGGYPSLGGFQQGGTQLVRLPSEHLGWWERNSSFEIAYDEESIARVLLDSNYIPEQIVGPGFDPKLRDVLHEKLGIEAAANEEGYREQLLEIVGEEAEEKAEEEDTVSRAEQLAADVERSVLVKVAGTYDDADEYLDELDKSSVSHLAQMELGEFLAGKDDTAVNERIDRVRIGEDL